MKFTKIWFFSAVMALTACGGGGGDGGGNTTTPQSTPSSGTPTATISNTSNTATALAKSSTNASSSAINAGNFDSNGQLNIVNTLLSSFPLPVSTAKFDQSCGNTGGMLTIQYSVSDVTTISVNDTLSVSYKDCQLSNGAIVNGSVNYKMTRFVSATDYTIQIDAQKFSVSVNGVTYGPVSYTGNIDFSNSIVTISTGTYNLGSAITVVDFKLTSDPTRIVMNATVNTAYDTGWINCVYNNWTIDKTTSKPVSGSITITGANGNKAVITVVNGSYQVDITINSVVTSYTVAM